MAKKAYVRNSDNTAWVELASATTDLTNYATKANPTFTGTVVLPSTTSVGNVTSTELGYLDGVTSAIQTQLNNKVTNGSPINMGLNDIQFSATGGGTVYLNGPSGTVDGNLDLALPVILTGSEVLVADSTTQTLTNKTLTSPKINENVVLTATATQLNYVSGVTSAIQTQLNAKANLSGATFSGAIVAPSGSSFGALTITSGLIQSSGDINISAATVNDTTDISSSVRMNTVYNKTSSSGANLLIATSPLGYLYRSTASSGRWKNSIEELTGELDASKLLELPVHKFKFNNDYLDENDQRYDTFVPGFIAEEVAEIYPIAAEKDADGLPSDWNSRLIIPPMLKLIQDQAQKITELELRIFNLENS